jgi:hypothetical protein
MTSTPASTSSPTRHARRAQRETVRTPRRARPRAARPAGLDHVLLETYIDCRGRPRELVALPAAAGSTLVVDRDAASGGDRRLLAHLCADEPAENAAILCRRYLDDGPDEQRDRCRRPTPGDARTAPSSEVTERPSGGPDPSALPAVASPGAYYRLSLVPGALSIPELRWCRHSSANSTDRGETVSVRHVVAQLESYEPVCPLTELALRAREGRSDVSTTVLRLELLRVRESPIVLNRGLRERVRATLDRHELSMSEIAMRCGRIKRDASGHESGETSWLARRIGLLPEGGQSTPTPWVHSDVLGLIARRGLGVSPREVEL